MAREMSMENDADIIFAAAGFTGVGALQEQQRLGKLAIGADSDQFFLAEKAVITSMVKNVDIGIYTAIRTYLEQHAFPDKHMIFGLEQNGVAMAPLQIITMTPKENALVDELKQSVLDGSIAIPEGRP